MSYDRVGQNNSNWRGGKTSHPLYWIYHDMIARCSRVSHARYKAYGGRGIKVCASWEEDFWNFVSDMGDRPNRHVLDRIDNDGDYTPENCKWSTYRQSNINRRTSGWEMRYRDPFTGLFT